MKKGTAIKAKPISGNAGGGMPSHATSSFSVAGNVKKQQVQSSITSTSTATNNYVSAAVLPEEEVINTIFY